MMKDTTAHAANCLTLPIDAEGNDRAADENQWKEVEAIVVLTPVMYEPLNQEEKAESEEEANEPIIDTLGEPDDEAVESE